MKKLFFLLVALPIFAFANPIEPIEGEELNINAINQALSSGNADALGFYFDESIEVAILGEEDIYSKSEAIGKVKSFFAKNMPDGFSQVHQGSSKGNDSEYCIGNMKAGGTTFRVYVYLGNTKGKKVIQELRFDKA